MPTPAERAWEKAQQDVARHDKAFEKQHGRDAGKPKGGK